MGGRKLCCRLVTDYDGGIIGTNVLLPMVVLRWISRDKGFMKKISLKEIWNWLKVFYTHILREPYSAPHTHIVLQYVDHSIQLANPTITANHIEI